MFFCNKIAIKFWLALCGRLGAWFICGLCKATEFHQKIVINQP